MATQDDIHQLNAIEHQACQGYDGDPNNRDGIEQMLPELRRRRLVYEAADALKKDAERRFKEVQARVFEYAKERRLGTISHDGIRFTPAETVYGQIQDREEFVRWCHTEGFTELLQEKEVGEELNRLVRQRLDDGEVLPPGVGVRVRQYISQSAS